MKEEGTRQVAVETRDGGRLVLVDLLVFEQA